MQFALSERDLESGEIAVQRDIAARPRFDTDAPDPVAYDAGPVAGGAEACLGQFTVLPSDVYLKSTHITPNVFYC